MKEPFLKDDAFIADVRATSQQPHERPDFASETSQSVFGYGGANREI